MILIDFLSRKLQLASEQINAQNVLAGQSKPRLIEEVAGLAKEPALENIPSIELYRTVYLTLTEPGNVEHFEKLKELILHKGEMFSVKEQKEIVQYLKNFCIKQINLGKPEFVERLFEIYKLSLQNKKVLRSEAMSPWEYKEYCNHWLAYEEFSWVQNLLSNTLNTSNLRNKKCVDLQYRKLVFFPEKFPRNFAAFSGSGIHGFVLSIGCQTILLKSLF